jgi:hypothetical protein
MTDSLPYQLPVAPLLQLDIPTWWNKPWLDYGATCGLTVADIPELTRLVWDEAPVHFEGLDATSDWVVHAFRGIVQLDPVVGLDLYLMLLDEFPEDDWLCEEFFGIARYVGAEAIEPVSDFLANHRKNEWSRIATANLLEELAQVRPEIRNSCIAVLMDQLKRYRQEVDNTVYSSLIGNLVQLKAVEAVDLIGDVFAHREVDEFVMGSWPWIQVELGVKRESDFSPEELLPKESDYILAIREAHEEKQQLGKMAAELLDISRSLGPSRSISPANPSMMPTPRKPASSGFGAAQTGKKAKKKKR